MILRRRENDQRLDNPVLAVISTVRVLDEIATRIDLDQDLQRVKRGAAVGPVETGEESRFERAL